MSVPCISVTAEAEVDVDLNQFSDGDIIGYLEDQGYVVLDKNETVTTDVSVEAAIDILLNRYSTESIKTNISDKLTINYGNKTKTYKGLMTVLVLPDL